jgi:Na+-driven multidrug efflux pump
VTFKKKMSLLNSYSEGLKQLTVFASPIIATSLVQETSIVFTLVFLGRMKNAEFIGGATLGNMVLNLIFYYR